MSRLPAELTDRIIDFLHSDRTVLKQCSLVCRDWLPSSRYHQFNRLSITPRNVRHVIALLNSPLSTIPKYSRTLAIQLNPYRGVGIHESTLLNEIGPYLERFNSRSLLLKGPKWIPVSQEYKACIDRWLAEITDLDLCDPNFALPKHFFGLIASCSSLESLTFRADNLDFSLLSSSINSFSFPSHLHTLRIFVGTGRDVVPWLLSTPPLLTARRLELYNLTVEDLDADPISLHSLPSFIQSFSIEFYVEDLGYLCDYIDLMLDLEPTVHPWMALSHLTQIEFKYTVYGVADFGRVEWARLDQTLTRFQFAGLRRVRISIYEFDGNGEVWVGKIRNWMCGLNRRNILDIFTSSQQDINCWIMFTFCRTL